MNSTDMNFFSIFQRSPERFAHNSKKEPLMTIPENWASIDPTNPCLSNPHSLPLQTNFTKKSKNKSQYSEEDEDLTEESNSDSNSEDEEDGTMDSGSGSECSSSSCSSSCSTCSDDEEDSDSSSSSISTSEIDFTKKSDQHQQRKTREKEKVNKQLKNNSAVNKNRFFVESRSVIKPRNSATASSISSAEFNFVDSQNLRENPSVMTTTINNISNKGSISQAETLSNHSQNSSNSKASNSKLVTVHQPNLNKKKNSSNASSSTNASTSTSTRKFFKRRAQQQQQQTVNNALVRCRLFMVPIYSFFFTLLQIILKKAQNIPKLSRKSAYALLEINLCCNFTKFKKKLQ